MLISNDVETVSPCSFVGGPLKVRLILEKSVRNCLSLVSG
jgi:hypothetical protein